ncbi:MAG: beta-glucosidase [Bacteroidetes bacterium]|nr:MAG: beta-glucosidase [Bacteroidota bacterium]
MLANISSCKKSDSSSPPGPPVSKTFSFNNLTVNGLFSGYIYYNVTKIPQLKFNFNDALDHSSVTSAITIKDQAGNNVALSATFSNGDSSVIIQPTSMLISLSQYSVTASTGLLSQSKKTLLSAISLKLITAIDSTPKFPVISDSALLDLVQQQTFEYFWEFAHENSGLARERNTSGNTVTIGGSGFGIMSILVGIKRNFISRAEGLSRMQKIVGFLKNNAVKFHGAFPHWMDGNTGAVIPFSTKDNGADLVETSYLMQGLLTARQFFDAGSDDETALRNDINDLWNGVEWSWFRKNNENVLYWHWSPDYSWDMNFPVKGWNEAMITYVLAASSVNYSIPKVVYDNGWASNGAIANNNTYFGYKLPLGPHNGGPLFFAHYSFLGINPNNLSDAYANYWDQNSYHTLINYNYCKSNPKNYFGYSSSCWGLTASDDNVNGYLAHDPDNDDGVISPTAALSSFPYTPTESMSALKFFYYTIGDKIWGTYGFVDAFSLKDLWYADSYLAIDQGPIVVMIENYRSGLLWNLFMSCPEIKTGMNKLGFQSPNL